MKNYVKLAILIAVIPQATFCNIEKIAFLKEKLITIPTEQAGSKSNILKKLLPAITLPILFDWCLLHAIKGGSLLLWQKIQEINSSPRAIEPLLKGEQLLQGLSIRPKLLPGLRSLLIYYLAHKIIIKKLERESLLQYVKEWGINKDHTPAELHPAFEQLYFKHKQNGTLDPKVANELKNAVTRLIQSYQKGMIK